VASAPEHNSEDGYKSPAYTATLELLSPSTELISKKKVLGKLKSITMGLASAKMDKRTQFIVSQYLLILLSLTSSWMEI
jgi:hypothetical protein